jgi:hypothetical protein
MGQGPVIQETDDARTLKALQIPPQLLIGEACHVALLSEGAHTLRSAVEAIDKDAPDPVRRLLVECRALDHLIGLGKGCCTGLRCIVQVPEYPAGDNRAHFVWQIN